MKRTLLFSCRLAPLGALFSLLIACGAAPDTLSAADRDRLRDRADSAEANMDGRAPPPPRRPPPVEQLERRPEAPAEEEPTTLPPAPAHSIWGDGHGITQHDAVNNARRVVAEQISARVEAESRSFEAEYNGESDSAASIKVRTTSTFDHAELIEILGAIRQGDEFVARASLDRAAAARVYLDELKQDREQLRRIGPTVEKAIAAHDAAVLLDVGFSPAHLIAEMQRKAAVLAVIDPNASVDAPPDMRALARRAADARAGTVIHLQVEGDVSERIRRATVGEVGRLLQGRGCRFVEGGGPPPEDAPGVVGVLHIATRDHEEAGILWRYLGFELSLTDARSGAPVFRYSAMPEIAHGGGPGWAQADQAAAKRLTQIIDQKSAADFAHLTCR
ncbi:MAG: hypothetical protein KC620_16750 [Myxococcales bacterium]|nr:hypothetical protein [Myxococcales bacterium]